MKEENICVLKASRLYGVPDQTLRDRISGRISIDTLKSGRSPIFTLDEELKLVNHLQAVAKYGYGYTRQEVVDIASDYSNQLGKRASTNPLTINWFRGFIQRWPELRVIKPKALELQRAKHTSASVINKYFEELDTVLTKYNLKNNPHLIFNIDEKGISQNHVPPYVVGGSDYPVQAVTNGKSQTTTILGCGSAGGQMIPPYFVFAGHRMMADLLKDSIPGTGGTVTETGWSNYQVFRAYLQEHFIKFSPQRQPGQHMLVLLDGHKSHVSMDLIEWAKSKEIILFILPAHTSHVLQPLDVGCYGPFQKIYNSLCHKFIRSSSGCISRSDVCSLASKAYCKAFNPENLHSAFKRTGISPLNRHVITEESILPSKIFECTSADIDDAVKQKESDNHTYISNEPDSLDLKLRQLKAAKSGDVNKNRERQTLSKFISGKAITEKDTENKVIEHMSKSCTAKKAKQPKVTKEKHANKKCKAQGNKKNRKPEKVAKSNEIPQIHEMSPKPGPSHINLVLSSDHDLSDSSDDDMSESEKCCVCKLFTPAEVRHSVSLIFTKWVQCCKCPHWVHLGYCTNERVVRRADLFFCVHCLEE